MPRLRIAAIAIVIAALGVVPAAARATVTSSAITSWVSSQPQTPANDPYLIYNDNPPTPTLTVSGQAGATSLSDTVDVECIYGSAPTIVKLAIAVPVHNGSFTTPGVSFKPLAGHACTLRAVDHIAGTPSAATTGPQLAVSEAAFVVIASGPNAGKPYDFYLNATTLTGTAAWSAPGTPSPTPINPMACGGPNLAPIDSSFNVGNPGVDCAGSLMADDLGAWGGRSEVQIDGHNAYDPASAQALFAAAHGAPASLALAGFPTLSTAAQWDPTTGLTSSTSTESWVACDGPNAEVPTFATCPSFAATGVQLQRAISSSDGGRVVTLTDTWSSTDNAPHALDLLYDDTVGLKSSTPRGYEFPGENGFSAHAVGDSVPGASAAPGSILAHTNLNAADGDPAETFGAITFSSAPSGFRFAPPTPPSPPSSYEFEERHVLQVPAGGSTSLSYVYSTDYALGQVQALALAAQDRFQAPAVTIASPGDGETTSAPSATLLGTASAGSGIKSLVVGDQTVPVAPDGTWGAQLSLTPGPNTITALAIDGAGATAQAQVTVVYQPPVPSPVLKCQVPRIKGMKLTRAERALRRTHCRIGKIKHVKSRKVHRGRVINSTPRAGRQLAAGSKVELFVSKGR